MINCSKSILSPLLFIRTFFTIRHFIGAPSAPYSFVLLTHYRPVPVLAYHSGKGSSLTRACRVKKFYSCLFWNTNVRLLSPCPLRSFSIYITKLKHFLHPKINRGKMMILFYSISNSFHFLVWQCLLTKSENIHQHPCRPFSTPQPCQEPVLSLPFPRESLPPPGFLHLLTDRLQQSS